MAESNPHQSGEDRLDYIETLQVVAQAWQCDHLGHVNVSFYMGWLGDAAFAMLALHGLHREEAARQGLGVAAVRAEVDYLSEIKAGDLLRMESAIEALGEKKIVFRHRLRRIGDGREAMRAKLTAVCMDLGTRKSRPFPAGFPKRIAGAAGAAA